MSVRKMPDATENLCRPGEVLKERWEIVSKLGAGGFGQIYIAKDHLMRGINVAVKVEPSSRKERAQLPMELYILKGYQGYPHAIPLYGAGTHEGKVNYIVMQLIGPNLASLRRMMKEPCAFTISTTMRLAIQCLEAIRDFHSLGAIHRDIKPSNFAMNSPRDVRNRNKVYILDFGLARMQTDLTGNLLPPKNSGSFQGTLRYCSLNAHKLKDLGRNDDLISYFYMMIEFLKGCLPWRDMANHAEITACKEKYNLHRLCVEFPGQLNYLATHLLSLSFVDRPKYTDMTALFNSIIKDCSIDSKDAWDWDVTDMLREPTAAASKDGTSKIAV